MLCSNNESSDFMYIDSERHGVTRDIVPVLVWSAWRKPCNNDGGREECICQNITEMMARITMKILVGDNDNVISF